MSIERDFNEFAQESREFQGKVLASLENLHQYITAVSNNHKELNRTVNAHMLNTADAHGKEASEKTSQSITQWVSLGISLIALGIAAAKAKP